MLKSVQNTYATSTDLADWMVKHTNLTFREAHQKTGEIVLLAEKKNKLLTEISIEELKSIEPKITNDIFNYLSIDSSVSNKKSYGGTDFKQIKMAIKRAKRKI